MILLDSNTIIYLSKKLIKIDDILEDNTIPLVSVVTYMEVLGYDFKDDSEKNFIKKLFSFLEIVYIGTTCRFPQKTHNLSNFEF